MDVLIPSIEENIPLPKNAQEAFPDLTPTEELNMRASVVALMSDLTGQPISPTQENVTEAKALAKEIDANDGNIPVLEGEETQAQRLIDESEAKNVKLERELDAVKAVAENLKKKLGNWLTNLRPKK